MESFQQNKRVIEAASFRISYICILISGTFIFVKSVFKIFLTTSDYFFIMISAGNSKGVFVF